MLRIRLSLLALASLMGASAACALTITEDFSSDPLSRGWQIFGEASLFRWNSTNRNLEVTWDSTRSNSYFYHALGSRLTRYDDFSLEFDLRLVDIASGVEPGKTGPLQIGFGFLDFAGATSTNFMRGVWGGAPNVAEFDYYPSGYYDFGGYIWDLLPTMTPSFISGSNSKHYAPAYLDANKHELPTGETVRVRLSYDGLSQTATLLLTTNGLPLETLPALVLNSPTNSQFIETDDFRVDMVSISSYSSAGDDFDSVLGHGIVDNLVVTTSLRAIGRFNVAPITNGLWQARFFGHSNWLYTLEGTTNLGSWVPCSPTVRGAEGDMVLQATSVPSTGTFFRVRAE